MSYYYKGDPYWTKARFNSRCCKCGESIKKGNDIFYYPRGKHVFCDKANCGQAESNSFESIAFDEAMYNGAY